MNSTYSRVIGTSLTALGLALMAGSLTYYALTADVYRSTARISIHKEPSDFGKSFTFPTSLPHRDWIVSRFEQVRAKTTLYPVVTNLDLQKKWAGAGKPDLRIQDAYHILRDNLEVRQSRDTPELFEITVSSADPHEAAQIANEIARVYRDVRLALWRRVLAGGIEVLEAELANKEQEIRDAEAWVASLEQEWNRMSPELRLLKSQHQDYSQSIQRLENQEKVHAALSLRIAEERQRLENMPSHVQVVAMAEPELRPVIPRSLIAGSSFAFGVLLLAISPAVIRKR
jgi:capsular polysaccharide biosynthesis protein